MMDPDLPTPTRRTVIGSAAGVTAAALAGPVASRAAAQADDGPVEIALVDYAFDPGTEARLVIPPGTTVRFVWRTDGHNISVDQKPADSDWQGHEPIEDVGFTHEHTFEVTGDYHFVCVPHEGLGMVGDITVEEGATVQVGSGGTQWSPPGGEAGLAFMAALIGLVGLSVAGVIAAESYSSVRARTDGPSSAYTTGLAVAVLAVVGLAAIVARLLLAA